MTSYTRYVASSVADYIAIVDALRPATPAGLWFRGHADNLWQLVPGALRDVEALTDGRGRPVAPGTPVRAEGHAVGGPNIEGMLRTFKQRARPYLRDRPQNDFEWMFLAQHHRLPTRLLDWSTNALVALYFAAERASAGNGDAAAACERFLDDADQGGDGFAVFAIDPGEINGNAHDLREPVDIAEEAENWSFYLDPVNADMRAYLPICVTAPQNSDRIRAQSGTFTLHGANVWALDYYTALRPMITKIFFPGEVGASVRASLNRLGMTRGFIYADLDSIAADAAAVEQSAYAFARRERAAENAEEQSAARKDAKGALRREAAGKPRRSSGRTKPKQQKG